LIVFGGSGTANYQFQSINPTTALDGGNYLKMSLTEKYLPGKIAFWSKEGVETSGKFILPWGTLLHGTKLA
jgi:hypothetical protein